MGMDMTAATVQCQLAYYLFGCGVQESEWLARYNELPEDDRETLHNVTMRLQAAQLLRYGIHGHLELRDLAAAEWFSAHDLPALEVAYLFGCLDTLAGSTDEEFGVWLLRQQAGSGMAWEAPLTTLEAFITRATAEYKRYKDETGVGAALRRLYAALCDQAPALIDWLGGCVKIERSSPGTHNVVTLDATRAARFFLFEHTYRWRRNPYTHESVTRYIRIEDDIRLGTGWFTHSGGMTYTLDRDRYTYRVYLREGLDEGTLLRALVHAAALHFLKLPVTDTVTTGYFAALTRQSALHQFLREMDANAYILRALDEATATPPRLDDRALWYYGAHPMFTDAAKHVVDRLRPTPPGEVIMMDYARHDIVAAGQLNELIDDFNKTHPPAEGRPPGQGDLERRLDLLAQLARDLHAHKSYSIVNAPGAPESEPKVEFIRIPDRIYHLAEHPW
jgi:hypothetical protein